MEKSSDRLGVEATTMAIREELMRYFKGSCVERVVENNALRLINLADFRERSYQYQRRQLETQQPMLMQLGNVPLMTLQHAPEKVTFHCLTFERSPQLREIKKEVEKFLDKYLMGIEKEESHASVIYE